MPIKCTIEIKDATDDYGEKYISEINVSDPKMKVNQNSTGCKWKIANKTGAKLEVRIRGLKNLTSPGTNPDDPFTDVTPRREVEVPSKDIGYVEVDVKGCVGDTHKYNVQIGKVTALDPEVEIQPEGQ